MVVVEFLQVVVAAMAVVDSPPLVLLMFPLQFPSQQWVLLPPTQLLQAVQWLQVLVVPPLHHHPLPLPQLAFLPWFLSPQFLQLHFN